jgi:hypothetical protein
VIKANAGHDDRCEQPRLTRAAGEKRDAGQKGVRCPNAATHYLVNGSKVQGQACEECALKAAKDFKFIELRPIT